MICRKSFLSSALVIGAFCIGAIALASCAGQRQGVVCDEIEYRYNSMSYSPDQRAFMEEELRACREEEARKKNSSGERQGSIYERYASQDSTKTVHLASDTIPAEPATETSVSEMLQDSTGKDATSIYDRYDSDNPKAEQDSVSE